jgi:hypothetical protein
MEVDSELALFASARCAFIELMLVLMVAIENS